MKGFFEAAFEVMMRLASAVLSLIPYGVFCLLIKVVGMTGFQLRYHEIGYEGNWLQGKSENERCALGPSRHSVYSARSRPESQHRRSSVGSIASPDAAQ